MLRQDRGTGRFAFSSASLLITPIDFECIISISYGCGVLVAELHQQYSSVDRGDTWALHTEGSVQGGASRGLVKLTTGTWYFICSGLHMFYGVDGRGVCYAHNMAGGDSVPEEAPGETYTTQPYRSYGFVVILP